MKNQEVKKSIETKENESGGLQGQSFPGCFINMSSSGLTRGSRKKESMLLDSGSAAGMTRGDESGRSMVEMLGVLAIMGVLAIGGIAGYRWAMDKYNANEILNEVRKRAVTASQQRILGHTINLSEYGNNGQIQGKYAVTTADSYDGDTNFFTITVQGIEQNICDKVLAGTIPFAIDTWVGADSDKCSGENNDMTFLFKNTLDPEQPAEWETTAAMTTEEIALTEIATASSSFSGSSEYTVSGSDGIWGTVTDSGYRPEETGTGTVTIVESRCENNADCKDVAGCEDGCYCAIDAEYDWDDSGESCDYKNYTGTCTPLDAGKPAGTYNGHTFLRSGSEMTWWSARNWCLAHDMKLTSLSDLGITGGYEGGYCWGTDCTGADWSGLKQTVGKDFDYSDWTDDSYNSCDAFLVVLGGDGSVGHDNRNRYYNIYALCVGGASDGGNPGTETTTPETTAR